jgi:ABC-type lipoprotein release transport system permease subunit
MAIAEAVQPARRMARFRLETSSLDPLTDALTPVLFCLLALVAAWAPARQAASVDPFIALRNN